MAWGLLVGAQGAVFLLRNMQVFLGFYIQILHYIPMGSLYGSLMLFLLLAHYLSQKDFWDHKVALTTTAFLLIWGLGNEITAAEQTYRFCGLPRHAESAFQWINEHAPKDALILSLSMETNESIPLYTHAKTQVPALGINYSGVFTKDKFLIRIAELLKTGRVDVERFIRERWLLHEQRRRVHGEIYKEQFYLGQVDPVKIEGAEWFYPYLLEHGQEKIPAEQNRLRAFVREASPLGGPFYFWVNAKDKHLLSRSPASFGGKLVYQNPTVDLYYVQGRAP